MQSFKRRGPRTRRGARRKRVARLLTASLSIGVVAGLLAALVGTSRPALASTVTLTYSYSSYSSGTTWTVPAGVTSITVDIRGGAAGKGGRDNSAGGAGGTWGIVTGTLNVAQGDTIGIYPGGSGSDGSSNKSGTGGGTAGSSSFSGYNGGRGGHAGTQGTSGGGGGGGAASVLRKGSATVAVAGGAGGGAGDSNQAAGSSYPGTGGSLISGTTGGRGAAGSSCSTSNDGGGGGGGGGGASGGEGGTIFNAYSNGWECQGRGGNRGSNSAALTSVTANTVTSSSASRITISYTLGAPSTPDLTAATDLGSSNTDDRTTWSVSIKPQFTGTAVGGAQVSLGVNGVYSINCGNANISSGAYTCTWTPSSDGTYTITARSTVGSVTSTSSSLPVTIDTARPTATLTRPAAIAVSRTVVYSLDFNESIYDLASADFSNSGTATGCIFSPSASTGVSLTVSVTCASDGTVVLRLASAAVSDVAGNTGPASLVTADVVTIDTVAPQPDLTATTINNSASATVRSNKIGTAYLVRSDVVVTNLASITGAADNVWNSVSISQANTDTSLSATGLSEGTYVLYTVDVNGLLSAASSTTLVIDNTAPSASWTPLASPVRTSSFSYTLAFTESISGLSAGDLSYGGTASGCALSPSATTGTTFTVSVTCTSDGTFQLSLASGSVVDVAANAGPLAITSAPEITIDAEFVITYDTQGGSDITSGRVTFGGALAVSPGTPTHTGFAFGGWSTSADGSAITFPFTHGQTEDFTLYALWSANDLSVTFVTRGGTALANATVKTNAQLTAPTPPTRAGFTFLGWSVSSASDVVVGFPYTHGQTSDFALFAVWSGNTIEVTFNSGTGGSAVSNGATVSGGTLAAPTPPTRTGFTFDGWRLSSTAGAPVTFPYRHGRVANFTLYAVWRSIDEPNNVWFYPGGGAASLAALVFAPQTGGQNLMVPLFPRSTETYEVSTTITFPQGVDQLDTVKLCLYKSDGEKSPESGVSSDCENAVTDPETELEIVWSQQSDAFEITGGSNNALANSATNYAVGNTTMNIAYRFKISHAMRSGNWTAAVVSTDKLGSVQRADLLASVSFYVAVRTARSPQSFGVIAPGGSATINDFSAGEYTANHNSQFTIEAAKFTHTPGGSASPVELIFVENDDEPTSGQVKLECSLGAALSNPIRLNTGSPKAFDETLEPTRESQRYVRNMSCRLTYGGGASRALVQYSGAVTFGVAARLNLQEDDA